MGISSPDFLHNEVHVARKEGKAVALALFVSPTRQTDAVV